MNNSVIERLNDLIVTISSAYEADISITIRKLADICSRPLLDVRKDIIKLASKGFNHVSGIYVGFENYDLYKDINDDWSKFERRIASGKLDDEVLLINLDSIQMKGYIKIDVKEYDAIKKITNQINQEMRNVSRGMIFTSPQYLGEEIYKICPDYNTYTVSNRKMHNKIVDAIEKKQWVNIKYKNENEFISIKPLRIVEYESSGRAYVLAQKGEKVKSYRLDRIVDIKNINLTDLIYIKL